MKIDLNSQEKSGLELRYKKARDFRESDRIKAVLLSSECIDLMKGIKRDGLSQRRH